MKRSVTGQDGSEMKEYQPQVQGFYSFLEKHQALEGGPIHSTAHFTLPFMAKSDFELVLLGWERGKNCHIYNVNCTEQQLRKEIDMWVVQISRSPVLQKHTTDYIGRIIQIKKFYVIILKFLLFI